ncbi:pyruvate kinase [Eleftheria terrae]|uniref:pyruvate kinase n=1 Tax=Eleftheria terrae TaxID=1597781 RepID=UPI00263B2A50|nr:pyruvate kinase [Eleftheria terrae]WKB55025.1 pyruvate kinase [Eleftheria terrae]
MHRLRQAKIVATLGPASSEAATIRAMFDAGVDVFRLNFSHGSHEDHRRRYEQVRSVERQRSRPIAVLADLQGPKLRVGRFEGGSVELLAGQDFLLDRDPAPGDGRRVQLPHPELFAAATPGQALLLDDGRLRLVVRHNDGERLHTRVAVGGRLSDRKGVNLPDAAIPIPALTPKDREDLAFALALGVDWVALSFVQRAADLVEARELVGPRAWLLAKIEKPAALAELPQIVQQADAVMVARGDLGVEMPPEAVPGIQRSVVRLCRRQGKPVIVATQMLESMVSAPVPTRAEASDVANAIYEGADAVMLSAESASGRHPVEAVAMMDRILRQVEADPDFTTTLATARAAPESNEADALCAALRETTGVLKARASVAFTTSGHTALRAARERPAVPILSLAPSEAIARRLALAWGVHSVRCQEVPGSDELVALAGRHLLGEGLAAPGDLFTLVAGLPFGQAGSTNLLRVARV